MKSLLRRLRLYFYSRRIRAAPHWTEAARVPLERLLGTANLIDQVGWRDDTPRHLRAKLFALAVELRHRVEDYNKVARDQLGAPILCAQCDAPLEDIAGELTCISCGSTTTYASADRAESAHHNTASKR